MADRITLERPDTRPAWQVRVGGKLVGLVWRQRGAFRAVMEGSTSPLESRFSSREAAARALARRAGFTDLAPGVVEVGAVRRGARPG